MKFIEKKKKDKEYNMPHTELMVWISSVSHWLVHLTLSTYDRFFGL